MSGISGIAAGNSWDGDLVDGGRESHGWCLDQGYIVAKGHGNIAGMLDPVRAGDGVGELGAGANGSSIVDGHGGGTIKCNNKYTGMIFLEVVIQIYPLVQCAAVRTQELSMMEPPHHQLPSAPMKLSPTW